MARIALYIIMIIICGNIYAQNAAQEINSIKQQPDKYIYAEFTGATWDEASSNAIIILEDNVKMWSAAKDAAERERILALLPSKRQVIKAMRGNLYRAFAYVEKTALTTARAAVEHVDNNQAESAESNTTSKPVDYATPTNVSPKEDNLSSVSENSSSSKPVESIVVQNEQNSESTVTMHIGETPRPADKEKAEELNVLMLSETEKKFVNVVDANDIGGFIKGMQADGYVTDYGKYSNLPSDGVCYVFVYNRELKVAAHLKKTGSKYINLISGKDDDITNYKGCGAYWFKLK